MSSSTRGMKRTTSDESRFPLRHHSMQSLMQRSAPEAGQLGTSFRSRMASGGGRWQRGMKAPDMQQTNRYQQRPDYEHQVDAWSSSRAGGQNINTRPRGPVVPTDQYYGQPGIGLSLGRRTDTAWNGNQPDDSLEDDNAGLMSMGSGPSDGFATMALKTQELEKERAAYNARDPDTNDQQWQKTVVEPQKEPELPEQTLRMDERIWWYKDPRNNVQVLPWHYY